MSGRRHVRMLGAITLMITALIVTGGRPAAADGVNPDADFKAKIHIRSYPVETKGGLVWTYMGPQPAPLLPGWSATPSLQPGQAEASLAYRITPARSRSDRIRLRIPMA